MSETPTQPYTLQAYIPHQDRPRDHGFSLPLPTTPEVARVFLDNYRITDIHNITIGEVYSLNDEDNNLSYWLNKALDNMGGPNSLDELNYLATKIQGMDEEQREIFSAALQAKWHVETIPQIVNLADNLQCFDLQPAATDAGIYGAVMLDYAQGDTAKQFDRLNSSDDPGEQRFVEYIQRLEQCVDQEAYGKAMAKEEGGVFTDYGYLVQYRKDMPTKYRSIADIPAEYSLNPVPEPPAVKEPPPAKSRPSLMETLKRNRKKTHEMFGNPQHPKKKKKNKGEPEL
jgi:hypothetical protein